MLLTNSKVPTSSPSPSASPSPKTESSVKSNPSVGKTDSERMKEFLLRKAKRERFIKKYNEALAKETDVAKKTDLQKKILDLQKNNKLLDTKIILLQKRIDVAKAKSAPPKSLPSKSSSCKSATSALDGGFYVKYLKYKAKYLQLKADLDV